MATPEIKIAGTGMNLHRIYGLTLASDFPFVNRFPEGSGIPDVTFRCCLEPPVSERWHNTVPLSATDSKDERGDNLFSIFRMEGYHVLHYAGVVDFYLWPDQIVAHLLDTSHDYLVEIVLLGEIFSLWFELHGIPAIHASAVVIDDHAIGFLSSNKGGKSALAAALMEKGYPLLTDDILPIEERNGIFFGRPGYPRMRMWPDEADFFLGSHEDLEIVHPGYSKRRVPVGEKGFGSFYDDLIPIKALYIPERYDPCNGVAFEAIPQKDAFIDMIRHSFSISIVEVLGLQVPRMKFFSHLVQNVPVRRLKYPQGLSLLSEVVESLVGDAQSIQ